jgi:hypothetical protein
VTLEDSAVEKKRNTVTPQITKEIITPRFFLNVRTTTNISIKSITGEMIAFDDFVELNQINAKINKIIFLLFFLINK